MNKLINAVNLPTFNYSLLSSEEKLATLENEKKLNKVFEKYQPEVGEILYNQQQVLANHGNGVFQEWYESIGFNRGNVYRYISKFKFLTNCEEPENRDVFLNAPISLQNEISKPSADPNLVQKVFDGDITTLKEYRQLEREKKQLEEKVEELTKRTDLALSDNLNLIKENKELKSRQPEVIETVIEKPIPVTPADYEELKNRAKNSIDKENFNRLKKEFEEKIDENHELKKQLKAIEITSTKEQHQAKIRDTAIIFSNRVHSFINDVGGLGWLIDYLDDLPIYEKQEYIKALELLDRWVTTIKSNIDKGDLNG